MTKPYYGHDGGQWSDALRAIRQFLDTNGAALSATITLPSGTQINPAVSSTSKRNREITSVSQGLELVIHEISLIEKENTFDGRIKTTRRVRFTLGAYGAFGSTQLDLAANKVGSEYSNQPVLESTYSTYATYAAAIGDTVNADIANFSLGRTYTIMAGGVEIGGPSLRDIYTINDIQSLVKQNSVDSRVALNTDPSIYADGNPATADPGGTGGWYYTNPAGQKINWYFLGVYPGAPDVTELGDIKNLFMTFYPRTTGTRAPYVTLYTRPQGDGNDAASWYRSRITYEYLGQSWTANSPVLLYVGDTEPSVDETLPRVQMPYYAPTSVGPQSPDEDIYLAAISTDSSESAGGYNFATTKVGYDSYIDGRVVTQLIGIG